MHISPAAPPRSGETEVRPPRGGESIKRVEGNRVNGWREREGGGERERERALYGVVARVRPTEAMRRREAISPVINNESSNGSPLLPLSSFLSNANCFQPPASTTSPPSVARREPGWETGEKRPVGAARLPEILVRRNIVSTAGPRRAALLPLA